MTKEPLISINVPTYNHENFLGECLESILTQSHSNVQIVVVDDCSTDGTLKIAEDYAQKHPQKIKLLANDKNLGVGSTYMRGYKECTGDYLCIFAGDDLMLPGYLTAQLQALQNNPEASISVTNGYWFDSDSGEVIKTHYTAPPAKKMDLAWIMHKQGIFAPATMIPDWARPPYDDLMRVEFHEWILFAEALSRGDGVYVDTPLIKYRRHDNNISLSWEDGHRWCRTALDYFETYLAPPPEVHRGYAKLHRGHARHLWREGRYKESVLARLKSPARTARYLTGKLTEKTNG